ncbi:MAG: hypothetical protein KJZ85_01190 [Rhodobacteraceae bacterium]|jgi:hypothetical protein|nr:hypothetical protein [Paracoccaceae bacterium]
MRLNRVRPFLAILLGLCLVAVGVARPAVDARAQPSSGLIEVVLCAEESGRTVLIDATGAPAEPGPVCPDHPCSDCLAAGCETLLVAAQKLAVPVRRRTPGVLEHRIDGPTACRLTPNARGPPTLRI